MWQLWLSGLIGIWLVFSPWVYNYYSNNTGALWNSIIFGIILLILAIWAGVDSKNKRQS